MSSPLPHLTSQPRQPSPEDGADPDARVDRRPAEDVFPRGGNPPRLGQSVVALAGATAVDRPDPTRDSRYVRTAWLLGYGSPRTVRAYAGDLEHWLAFCARSGIDALAARRAHVDAWVRAQEYGETPSAPSTIARRLAAVSRWYRWLVSEELISRNPVADVRRPRVSRDESSTVGLTREQAGALLDAAVADRDGRAQAVRNLAVVTLLLANGLRCGELVGLDLADLGSLRGHRTLHVHGKGGSRHAVPLAPPTQAALDAWLAVRGDNPGPLFTTARGRRLAPSTVFRMVRRLALLAHRMRPDLDMATVAARLSPHGLRHTAITAVLDAGVSLRDAQDFARHADPRTTRRYDRNRHALDRHATYVVSTYLAAARRHGDASP